MITLNGRRGGNSEEEKNVELGMVGIKGPLRENNNNNNNNNNNVTAVNNKMLGEIFGQAPSKRITSTKKAKTYDING